MSRKATYAGVDIGGTFTDLVWTEPFSGDSVVDKVLTTNEDPSTGVEMVLAKQANHGFDITQLSTLIHGSTLVTNAIIERKGALTALLTTRGFRDVLHIARQRRYDMYDIQIDLAVPLIPRRFCYEISERVLANGTVEKALDSTEIPSLAVQLRSDGVESLAICLMHSYRNPEHERALRNLLSRELPGLPITISSEVAPEIREYERASTTAANAYVRPIVQSYLHHLQVRLAAKQFQGGLYIMTASGGSVKPDTASQFPVRMIESGPAAGALAAAAIGRARGEDELLSLDMGGTTAKACLIEQGTPLTRNEFEADRQGKFKKGSGLPIRARVVDMVEIGAGGGSLAHWDEGMGLLRVGPESAGSEPGPVAYGKGGRQPTVTDAALVLGYLNPGYFLGGEMTIDIDGAFSSIAKLAKQVGRDVVGTAAGICQVVNENMAAAARLHAVERGKDPRGLSLYAFGGAGPVHAYAVARLLGARRIVVPSGAGTFSAFGLLSAPIAFDMFQSSYAPLADVNWNRVNGLLHSMEKDGRRQLSGANLSGQITVQSYCEMRYMGQAHEVQIALPSGSCRQESTEMLRKRFEEAYRARYHRIVEDVPLEILTWGVRVSGPLPKLMLPDANEGADIEKAKKDSRNVYWDEFGETATTPVYERNQIGKTSVVRGPAIIEERESTTVIGPSGMMTVDSWNNLVINL